jgi:hypothetical protein
MKSIKNRNLKAMAIALLAFVSLAPGSVSAAGKAAEVAPARLRIVGDADLQARVDHKLNTAGSDRASIQRLLERSDVRSMAGSMGLNVDRASDAVAVMSDSELGTLSASLNEANAGVGGDSKIVISTTAIIIILLVLILLSS